MTFPGENFLLEGRTAIELYHGIAARLPIIDFHNHLSPRDIAEDRRFENLTRLWLEGDHYKWRAMRANGVPERFITGAASDWEKFEKWADTVPMTLRNPLYEWTHMELRKPLGMADFLLSPDTARAIWDRGLARLAEPDVSARGLLRQAGVVALCTTDDPTDDLRWHRALAADSSFRIRVLPTFRPDAAFALDQPVLWNAWVDRLAQAARVDVRSWPSLLDALRQRVAFFHQHGARLSDHGLEQACAEDCPEREARRLFTAARSGRTLAADEILRFRSALLHELGLLYAEHGWTQQFHLGALRNANTRLAQALGRDAGCDSIGDFEQARPLARMLDRWDRAGKLARTVIYNVNPRDNASFAAMAGNFQDETCPGKIQYGSAWWFLDQRDGIVDQLDALSAMGLLSRFVGMVTDSRSLLSFSRHEYFRRILCSVIGRDVERGLLPDDTALLARLVRNVCFENARTFFGFDAPAGG